MNRNAEHIRLQEAYQRQLPWLRWGPYLSERQWGTVRENFPMDKDPWEAFTHDQARSRAYEWGEDGLAGICDEEQRLCLAIALWNERDPFLKERLFGLTNPEGNHGEDVKEYYYYLDNTPTHSYMKYLYKYPQEPFPYDQLLSTNRKRSREEPEYELIDTGIFDEDRYFDVEVKYAKAAPGDVLMQVRITNRGPDAAPIHLLPTLWYRNTRNRPETGDEKPVLRSAGWRAGQAIAATLEGMSNYYLYCSGNVPLLFTENETNKKRIFGEPNESKYVKDGINDYVVDKKKEAVNPAQRGTKGAMHYRLEIPPGASEVLRFRFCEYAPMDLPQTFQIDGGDPLASGFEKIFEERKKEADAFYHNITPETVDEEDAQTMRQALAGMLWTKQFYYYDLDLWLKQRGGNPLSSSEPKKVRNQRWVHMVNKDIISMPDKWEYPWYAAWDLAFQTINLAMVDLDFAKQQLSLMLRETYLHPNGQLPAYEWNFSDVNPPVHAWATLFVYSIEKQRRGSGDLAWLKNAFQKLTLNFTWWVNRKDPQDRNIFEGGFLGLDNIGVFDRSETLPGDAVLEQADGTAWMTLFCQNMFEMALELAIYDPVYEDMALKFFEHFLFIASAMDHMGDNKQDLWDDEDGFFYDLLRQPDSDPIRLKVRSMVGLLPLCATTVIDGDIFRRFPKLVERAFFRFKKHPELLNRIHDPRQPNFKGRYMFSILDEEKLRRVLSRLLDENEFLSPYGIRALSRYYADHPYEFFMNEERYVVEYLPAESDSGMFGGNSNWRGPVWFPVNTLLLRALLQFYTYYGDDFKVECPTGSGHYLTLFEVSKEIATRLIRLFRRDEEGRRPVYGDQEKFQRDPHFHDHLLFYEYFHGDNGSGLGASHQTGWTGLVAFLIQLFGSVTAEKILEEGFRPATVYREE